MSAAVPQFGVLRRAWGAVLLRCPRCLRGGLYGAPFRMRERCPACGLAFEREPGYFTGAMYASYFFGIFATLPAWLWLLLGGARLGVVLGVAGVLVAALMPAAFHFSRAAWMQIDCYFNPGTFVEDARR